LEKRRIYVFDDLCNGCRNCEMACSFANFKEFHPRKSKIKVSRVIYAGLNYPIVDCDGQCPAGTPQCVAFCPTGCLTFVTRNQAAKMKQDLVMKREIQPVFKFIAPWKWAYPWRPWPK